MEQVLIWIILALSVASVVLSVIKLFWQKNDEKDGINEETALIKEQINQLNERTTQLLGRFDAMQAVQRSGESQLRQEITNLFSNLSATLADNQRQSTDSTKALLSQFEQRLQSIESSNAAYMANMREEMARQLGTINTDTKSQLAEMRTMVGEKLQTTLDDKISRSFATVSEQLNKVYSGLGEMQSLAVGVGDLKKVLSNVKNRGILGEMQLGAILSDILAPEQYDTEVMVVPGSRERVEFAVKLPGKSDKTVYLPIDSKFPGDKYTALTEAYDSGDKLRADEAAKALCIAVKKCAKDIHDKYICPPHTTDFAVMFLPFEGLYAEVVRLGLVEELQRSYRVNIAGPSTMAALLNSLYMGFRTLAVQKRSGEVWQILGAVKKEFENFEEVLTKTKKHLQQVDSDLETLVGVRTRAINKQLLNISEGAESVLTINAADE